MTVPAALKRARRGVATLTPVKPYRIHLKQPIISFTFDDAPKTAWTSAGEILGRYGFLGTYYCSGDLLGQTHPALGTFCDADDVRALIREGHEIGCHTRTHLDCQTASRRQIEADMAANRKLFAEEFDQHLTSFAYPYGIVTLGAKFAASSGYASARGTRPGINRRIADLAQLKTIAIDDDLDNARRLIDETRRHHAWLIFYTHDVQENASPFGCTPEAFENVVKLVRDSGCEVLPVKNAMGAVGFHN